MKFVKDFNKTAIIYEGENISYGKMIRNSKMVGELVELNKGEKAIIYMENRPEFFYSFLGIWDKKGLVVCLDAGFSSEELEYFIEHSESKYILTSEKNYKNAKEAVEKLNANLKIINIDEIDFTRDYTPNADFLTAPNREDVALMLYTSGTTGKPKGVMLTFDNIMVNIEGLEKYNMFIESDIVLSVLPLHHVFPLLGAGIMHFYTGGTIVLIKELNSDSLMRAFKEYGITIIIGVPRLWEMLHKKIMSNFDTKLKKNIFKMAQGIKSIKIRRLIFKKVQTAFGGKIRFFVSGGSKLDPKIASDLYTLGFDVLEGYGMTETAPMISFTPIHQTVPGSVGKVLNGVELKIEDGEIWVRGKNVMKGYYKNQVATDEAIDKDGFLHTGDLGHVKNGYLFVTGRKKEMIVLSNGKNINPIEIENFLLRTSNLIDEVVVAEIEKKLTAVIYPNFKEIALQNVTNIKETLKWGVIDKYNASAPKYRKLLDIKIVQQELPKTKLGKVRRFMVPDLVKVSATENIKIEEPDFKEYKKLKKYLEHLKDTRVLPMSHLELDLGLDSLDMVELLSYLENDFGILSNEKIIVDNPTVEELANYIKENQNKENLDSKNLSKFIKKDTDFAVRDSHWALYITKFLLWLPFRIYVRLKKHNLDRVEKGKPKIFVGNHQSFLDPFIFIDSTPISELSKTYSIAKIKHFNKGFMKTVADNSNVILLDINKNLRETLKIASHILKEGDNLLIFPEGARTRDGRLQEFKKTFAILSKELGVSIQPFVINGAYKAYPTGNKLPKFSRVDVKFLEPIDPKGKKVAEIVEETRNAIEKELEL